MKKLALLLLLAVPTLSACVEEHACTLIGCNSTATIQADVPASWDRLSRSAITACRNGTCFTGSFSAIPIAPNQNAQGFSLGERSAQTGIVPAAVSVVGRPDGTFAIDVIWQVGVDAKNGDAYKVTVTDDAGASLLSLDEKVAAYQESQPNGPECGPTCHSATIDRRTR